MSRLHIRRGRILPGPLRTLSRAERSPVPVTALALTSAAIAAGLLLMPQLSPRLSVDPTPMVEFASATPAEPEAHVYAASEATMLVAATPAPVAPVISAAPQPVATVAPEPASPAPPPLVSKPAVIRSAAAAPTKPAVDPSLFQLDLLPVLQADGADLDTGAAPAAPQRVATKPVPRKTAAASRGSVQP